MDGPGMPQLTARQLTGVVIAGITVSMAVPLVIWLTKAPARFTSELLGITPGALDIPWAWLLAAATVIGYVRYTFWAVPSVKEAATSLNLLKLAAIPLALVSGTLEELVFRKFLMDWLDSHGVAAGLQILATALAFGLAHSVWVLFARDAQIFVPVVASTTAMGGVLGATYLVGNRIALPVILAHVAINLVIEPGLLLSSITGAWKHPRHVSP